HAVQSEGGKTSQMLAKRGIHDPSERDIRIAANMIKNTLDRYDGKAVKSNGANRNRLWSIK
ncbi:MAG TPA: hypothetical protein VGZ47_17645, partial [Gemmataceae bacterium]|nr:hypothetical protein [Gemmataceae bacterium]